MPSQLTQNDLAIPQDPFLPQGRPLGPVFLDTEACLCALRGTNHVHSGESAWECIGNQTQGVYEVQTGKWFNNIGDGTLRDGLGMSDASNTPDTSKALMYNNGTSSLVDIVPSELSVWDQACTGRNRSSFSTSYYRSVVAAESNDTPTDAAPCWRPGAFPIQIQEVTDWQTNGCNEGFLCANNTVNSLPQFCPPITDCQIARLAGFTCSLGGTNIAMGPFEPVVCQQGWYCPKSSGGTETLRCPTGTYCQPGAPTPTPCSVGSWCPEGSTYETFVIPIVILILVDLLLAIIFLWYFLRKRFFRSREQTINGVRKGKTTFKRPMAGYKPLEADHEMLPMQATYMPTRDAWTGFEAALNFPTPRSSTLNIPETEFSPELRAFVESMRRATDGAKFGLSFAYSNLSFHPKGNPKPILQAVTGSIERGSLTAVMGGSGAGKSTFVNVLMGKVTNTSGTVMINNVPGKIKRYKKLIGYVPQDDIVLPELTVYENILHSARIRLPRAWKEVDIQAHVNSVIDCLELSHVRDSLVGSVGKPVISGGQRKRVSIGMELAAAPMAIFLDEPTSGLDATSATSIMRTLKAIARLGISVIVIIHQPRMEIFEMLDDLILLANGQIIYEGPETGVRDFFENVGFQFPTHSNFGDVVTDIVTGNGRAYKRSGDISKDSLIAYWAQSRENSSIKEKHASMRYSRTSIAENNSKNRELLRTRGAPRLKQLWLCLARAMLQQWRARTAFCFEMGLASVAGLLLGLAQNSKKGVLFTGIYNAPYDVLSLATDVKSVPQLALLTVIAIGLVAAAPGVRVFSEEMLLYRREAEAGHSRIAYFMAKNLSVLLRMVFGCMHFTTLLLILSVPIIGWGTAFMANLVYFYCIYGLASCVSMVVRREDAPLIATMISLIVGILCGAAPPLASVIGWHMEWLWRASPATWLAELYFGRMIEPFRYLYNVDLAAQQVGFHLDRNWTNIGIIVAIGTAYRVLAWLGLLVGSRLRI
ncbi:uncharacterized protein F4807DRAFT_296809 [Annulohypoxylon truncatum]|uniref:uncharacterized protein n=1 Tax=Annulohypoxylon truncatum TaxID=327061 RepID=UPI002007EB35|nr:uncharacterized protein F4807DRAFT_296809 [Annulohypoxylon truncatum]KAI1204985.1 hypothetical protein F4807DRAFT_296809 [Annulohypoxylon truncatum]